MKTKVKVKQGKEILSYPAPKQTISQPFGKDNTNHSQRKSFYKLFGNKHSGVDFKLKIGTPVSSAYSGVVVRKEFHKGMGNVIGIRNGNIICLYAHLSKFKVKLGNIVKNKQLIGLSGDTGKACLSPHLHFEMRDITKPSLKQMVFDPPFNKPISQWKPKFTYTVNNTNIKKTWKSLAQMYFGNHKLWRQIKRANPGIKVDRNNILPDRTKIIIPNYKSEPVELKTPRSTSGFGRLLNKLN